MSDSSHGAQPDDPQIQSDGPETPPEQPLSVLHLIKGLGPGGAERLIVNQLASSTGQADYCIGYVLAHKDHLVDELQALGGRTQLVRGSFWPLGIRKLIRQERPDVIHAHSPLLAVVARVLKATKQTNASIITTEHNRWPRHHRLTRGANAATAPLDDHRIAVSIDVRDSMSDRLKDSTIVLDHGVPVDAVRDHLASREEMRESLLGHEHDSVITIGIVANFRPEKAYDVFLAAALKTLERAHHVNFVVVGQGPGEAAFREAVNTSGQSEKIQVLGYRSDALDVMSAFDIFTLTSRHEGKPVSLMEAFAMGLPAVATRAGGIPEAIRHGYNGMLVEIDDVDALADAWVKLANDGALLGKLAQGAEETSSEFDSSVATRSIESTYISLTESSP